MRFMIIVKATKESETGATPSPEMIACMGKYNEELTKAGVMLDAAGLRASKYGARVKFGPGKKPTVVDGPFTEAKELIAGYWMIDVKSLDEAVEWVKRVPNPTGEEAQIEIRQVFEAEDFDMSPEVAEQNRRLREHVAGQRTP